jgi:hypothetical protein
VVGHTIPLPYKVQLKLQFPVSLAILPDDLTARSVQLRANHESCLVTSATEHKYCRGRPSITCGEGGVYSPYILKLGTRQRMVVAAYRGQFAYHEMPSAPTDRKLGGSRSPNGGLEKLLDSLPPDADTSVGQLVHQAHQPSHGHSHYTELLSHEYGALIKRRNVGSSASKLGTSQLG